MTSNESAQLVPRGIPTAKTRFTVPNGDPGPDELTGTWRADEAVQRLRLLCLPVKSFIPSRRPTKWSVFGLAMPHRQPAPYCRRRTDSGESTQSQDKAHKAIIRIVSTHRPEEFLVCYIHRDGDVLLAASVCGEGQGWLDSFGRGARITPHRIICCRDVAGLNGPAAASERNRLLASGNRNILIRHDITQLVRGASQPAAVPFARPKPRYVTIFFILLSVKLGLETPECSFLRAFSSPQILHLPRSLCLFLLHIVRLALDCVD